MQEQIFEAISQFDEESLTQLWADYKTQNDTSAISIHNAAGQTPIEYAASIANWDCVEFIANQNEDTADNSGHYDRALHLAIKNNQTNPALALIQAKANLNYVDANGWFGIHYAVVNNNLLIIDFLIKAGVDPYSTTADGVDIFENVKRVCKRRNIKIMPILTRMLNSLSGKLESESGQALLLKLIKDDVDVDEIDKDIILFELELNNWEFIDQYYQKAKALLTQGYGSVEELTIIIEKRMLRHAHIIYRINDILTFAVSADNQGLIDDILEFYATYKLHFTKDPFKLYRTKGLTALHYAVINNNPEVVSKLLSLGYNFCSSSRDLNIESPMDLAAKLGNTLCLEQFISLNVPEEHPNGFSIEDEYSYTLTHCLLNNLSREYVEKLLEFEISVDKAADGSENNPLHLACKLCDAELLSKLLTKPGADLTKVNDYGLTPIMLAHENKDIACIMRLAAYDSKKSTADLRIIMDLIQQGIEFDKLIISKHEFTDELYQYCTSAFKNASRITDLKVSFCTGESDYQFNVVNLVNILLIRDCVTKLDLSNSVIFNGDITHMATILKNTFTLRELNLSFCNLDKDGLFSEVSDLIKATNSLVSLDLSGNHQIPSSLAYALDDNISLSEIKYSNDDLSQYNNDHSSLIQSLEVNKYGPRMQYDKDHFPQLITLMLLQTIDGKSGEYSIISALPTELIYFIFETATQQELPSGIFYNRTPLRFARFRIEEKANAYLYPQLLRIEENWKLKTGDVSEIVLEKIKPWCDQWDDLQVHKLLESHQMLFVAKLCNSPYINRASSEAKLVIIDFILRFNVQNKLNDECGGHKEHYLKMMIDSLLAAKHNFGPGSGGKCRLQRIEKYKNSRRALIPTELLERYGRVINYDDEKPVIRFSGDTRVKEQDQKQHNCRIC